MIIYIYIYLLQGVHARIKEHLSIFFAQIPETHLSPSGVEKEVLLYTIMFVLAATRTGWARRDRIIVESRE